MQPLSAASVLSVGATFASAVALYQWHKARSRERTRKAGEPTCDFVLMGHSGFIGAKMLDAIRKEYHVVVVPSTLRLQQPAELRAFLGVHRPCHGVVCCSGTRGIPNIDWCDENPIATIDVNICGQLNVATLCAELDLHCALVGTGFVYAGKDGKAYTEEDVPDSTMPKTYIKLRIVLEQLLAYYPNVLNLRVIYPITSDLDDKRGLIGKLAGFPKVDDATGSCTFLETLCPLVPVLMKKKVSGPLNFTNPGTVSYRDIVERLKRRNPGYDPEIRPLVGRPAIVLDTSKLVASCAPECEVPTAEACLARMFEPT